MSDPQAAPPSSLSAFHSTLIHSAELPKSNKFGIASLFVGLAAVVLAVIPFLGPALGLAAVCLGAIGVYRRGLRGRGRLVAVIGMAIGVFAVVGGTVVTIAIVNDWNHVRPCNQTGDPDLDPAGYRACLERHAG